MGIKIWKNQPKFKKIKKALSWTAKITGTILLIFLTTGIIFACILAAYIKVYLTPQLDLSLKDYTLDLTSTVYYTDSNGQAKELATLYDEENRVWVDYEHIPENLEHALVAIEDKRFYEHRGVDWYRTFGAFGNMFLSMRDTFGGSTITQQLIKNLTEEDEVTVQRKMLEIFRALDFEKNYSKQQIVEWYMNTIYIGEGCNGVGTAANVYFGKDVSQLDLAECASLIGITNNPSVYDPYINKKKNKERQELILKNMLEQGYITEEEYEDAVSKKLVFVRGENEKAPTVIYSYYVDQLIEDVINDLVEQKGISRKAANKLVYSGGYKIYACIDPKIQAIVDSVYSDLNNIPKTINSKQQLQSAMAIMDPDTGDIVAMVGGVGEKTGNRVLNRATQTLRPPGSAIKPLAVYSPAINLGYITPAKVMEDSPLRVIDNKLWPKGTYSGQMTIKEALRISSNTIAAKVLEKVTPQLSYDFLTNKLGITSLVIEREIGDKIYTDIDVAPLALGGLTDGVSVIEMTAAYATFSNNGIYTEPRTYTKVLDSDGNVVLEKKPKTIVAIKETTAAYINDLLKNVVAAGTGTAAKIPNMTVAGKTGTTDVDKDRWFVGYTPYYAAAVWTGYDTPEKITTATYYSNPAATLWQLVMSKVHEGFENKDFVKPGTFKSVNVCADSGLLPAEVCKHDIRGSRVITVSLDSKDIPRKYCDVHRFAEICSESKQLAGPFCPIELVEQKGVLDLHREPITPEVYMTDDAFVYSKMQVCPVHTEPIIEFPEFPEFPIETDDPLIPPEESGDPNGSTPPTESPTPSPTTSPAAVNNRRNNGRNN